LHTHPTDRSAWVVACTSERAEARRRGACPDLETLLARHPGLDDETSIRLIYEDVCSRREEGESVPTEEVLRRFPRFLPELRVLFDCDRLLRTTAGETDFPEVGEDIGPYQIVAELGRGGAGRTYLACEPSLADRLVVLKVVPDDQDEHLSLARLQHTHIIPLFSELPFPERGVRALCMPYLGGASLERLLAAVASISPASRRGSDLIETLDRNQAHFPVHSVIEGPCRRFLERATWTQAICWITACLADALHAAHTHGLVHMDVKPPNVLLAGDGLPLLLDFHLARRPISAGELIFDRLGGTEAWMAPEQRVAMESARLGRPVSAPVDARCDIYALGLLLRAALDGPMPPAGLPTDKTPWAPRNPEVGAGLIALVRRCLEPNPAARYEDAATLADDLRRHLNDLPLRGVPNRSLAERWRKWRRRRPDALWRGAAWSLALGAVLAALTLSCSVYYQRSLEVRKAIDDGRKLRLEKRYDEAAVALARGLERVQSLPGLSQREHELRVQLRLTQAGQRAEELHRLAELVRFRYGIDPPAPDEGRVLVQRLRAIWDDRGRLLGTNDDANRAETDRRVRTDLLELAVVWADLRTRLALPGERAEACREAQRVLDEARAECGPSPAIDRQQTALAIALGQTVATDLTLAAPHGAWEHYDLGRYYLRSGRIREAIDEFEHSLAERSQDFWPNFYQGLCAYRLGQFHEALAAFRACIALAPHSAACYYNRARVAEAMGRTDQAVHDYSRAVELDRGLMAAFLNRGALAYKDGRHDGAIADFRDALRATSDTRALGLIHYNLALAYLARGDRASALASAQEALDHGHDPARGLRDRLRRER